MGYPKKNRTKSQGPPTKVNEADKPKAVEKPAEDVVSENNKHLTDRKRGRHGQMIDLLTADDRTALNLNKYEQSYTLAQLQDKIKRQADHYKPEFRVHFAVFQNKLREFKENPAKKDQDLIDYFKFMAHVSGVYRAQVAQFLAKEILDSLQQYYSILHAETRMCLVTCLKIMRGKETVPAAAVLPVFLKLFKCQDKELRKMLHASIVSDLKELNKQTKQNQINKKLQNFILQMLQDANEDASKRSLNVMIELYKRHIWNDDKTVNAIWAGVEHADPKIVANASKFFLILDYDYQSESDVDSDEAEDAAALLKHHKGSKLTKAKKAYLERAIKSQKRKEQRKNKVHTSTDFLPIDTLFDPQACADRLFNKLKRSNDKYEVKLLMLRLVARLIGRHNLLILGFYPYILRYLNSHEKDKIGEIFAMIIESTHDLIPPEDIKPVMNKIIDNFVTEYCSISHIVTGLNAIREILVRMPLALDTSQVEYLVEFRSFRNKSVVASAKSLVNYFRDVCPQLLPKKFVGRFTEIVEKEAPVYGHQKIHETIDGIEYLKEGADIAKDRLLTQEELKKIQIKRMREAVRKVDRKGFRSSSEESGTSSDEGEEGEADHDDQYERVRNPDYVSGDEDGEELGEDDMEEGEEEDDDEAAPQLVPAKAGSKKAGKSKDIIEFAPDSEADDEMSEEGEDEVEEQVEAVPVKKAQNLSKSPAKLTGKRKKPEEPEENSDVPSESSYHSSELAELEEAMGQNPHGFIYAHDLMPSKLTKAERLENQANEEKDPFAHKKRDRKTKTAGTSNKAKLRNKAFNMLLPSKVRDDQLRRDNLTGMKKKKDKNMLHQLGHFSKQKRQQLESKKRKAVQGT